MKVLKRLIASVLCASIAAAGTVAFAAEKAVYSDNFDAYGNADIPEGNWSFTTPGNSCIAVENQKLKITTPSSYSGKAIAQYTLPKALDGVVTIEYKAMINAALNSFCAPYIYSDTGALAVCTMFNNNGSIQTHANGAYKQVGSYKVGEWYSVKHVIDYDNAKFSLYINDEECITGASFRNGASANMSYLQFYAEKANTQIYFDDFKISAQAEEPAPEKFGILAARVIYEDTKMSLYDGILGVPCDIKAVELEFSTEPDTSTLSNISINAAEYEGSYADKVWHMELTEELLKDTEYTIIINGVRSKDGAELSEKIRFTTIEDVLYFEGFELSGDSLPNGWSNTSGSAAVAYDDERRSRVLAVTGRSDKSEAVLELILSDYGITAGDIVVIDFDVNTVRSANASVPYIYNASGQPAVTSVFAGDGTIKPRNGDITENMCAYTQGKWHNVKICLDTKNSSYNFILDGVLTGVGYKFRNTLAVNGKCTLGFYIDAGKSGTVKADNLKIYKATAPKLEFDNTEFINGGKSTKDINNVFAGNTSIYVPCGSTVYSGEFTLYKNGEAVDVKSARDKNGFSLDIDGGLAYGAEYTLKTTVKSIYGNAADYEYSFKTANNTVYVGSAEFGEGGAEAVIVNNTGAPCVVNIFLASYDENNYMTGCTHLPKTLETGENQVSVTLAGNGKYKLYVWSGDMLSPEEYGVYTETGVEGRSEKTPNSADNTFTAENSFSVVYPDTAVEIKAASANGGQMTLIVLKPDAGISDFTEGDIVYIGQRLCDEKTASFNFNVAPDLASGEYKIYIGGESAAAHKTAALSYVGVDSVSEKVSDIDKSENAKQMLERILSGAVILGVNTAGLENMPIADELYARIPFKTPDNFTAVYNDVYYSYLFNNADDVSEDIASYAEVLGIDLGEDSRLSELFSQESKLKKEVEKAVAARNDFTGVGDIRSCYYEAAALGAVNSAARGTMISRCESFADVLGVDIEGGYASLTESQKQKLAIMLIDAQPYSSADVFAKKLAAAAEEVRKQTASNTTSGGGGGGGGSAFVGAPSVAEAVTENVSYATARLFADVDDNDWFAAYVNRLGSLMIVSGDENGSFNPDNDITRAEFIKLLAVVFDCCKSALVSDFDDVAADKWYSPYIAGARAAGFVNGYDNKVMPDSVITRQDAAVMAVGAAEKNGVTFASVQINFSDSGLISDYAVESVSKAVGAGIMSGMGDGSFAPAGNMTRAQAAVVICGLTEVLQ